MKKRGLGRNLDVFISRTKPLASAVTTAITQTESTAPNALPNQLPVSALQAGRYQPRKDFASEALQELADSIREQGIIQPLVVRNIGEEKYEIIAGERRFRAAQLAGLTEVPVVIRDIPDEAALAISLIENIQREDLNPLEEAVALQRLLDEFGLTHQEIARAVGKSRTTITNLLRLLSLEADVKRMLENGDIEMGHARALLALQNMAQIQAARTIVARGLSVRETEDLVRKLQSQTTNFDQPSRKLDPDIQRLQQKISERLGTTVNVKHTSKGKGTVVIHYNNLHQLDGILEQFDCAEA